MYFLVASVIINPGVIGTVINILGVSEVTDCAPCRAQCWKLHGCSCVALHHVLFCLPPANCLVLYSYFLCFRHEVVLWLGNIHFVCDFSYTQDVFIYLHALHVLENSNHSALVKLDVL